MAKGMLGAQLFTCREYTKDIQGVASTLKKVADIGYRSVQVSGFGPVDPMDVARAVEDAGLVVGGTHIGWGDFLHQTDAVIEKHKLWKCTHSAIGALGEEYRSAEGLKRFLDELPPVAEKLLAEGIDFSFHNHSHELIRFEELGGKTWLDALYEQSDPAHLKAEIDTYWIQHGGADPAAWVRKMAGREPLLHLKDMCVVESGPRMAEVGEGNLNWPAILEAADGAGVEFYLVEQDDCYERDCFESLAISYRNLQAMGLS